MRRYRRGVLIGCVVLLFVVGSLYTWKAFFGHGSPDAESVEAREGTRTSDAPRWQPEKPKPKSRKVSNEERERLLARAQLWHSPAVPIEQASFTAAPDAPREIACRFHVTALGGTTPKFDCNLESGELVRIKYGKTGEVPAEVAATRLLRALGFGADYVDFVQRLRCYGCPKEPFSVMKAVEVTQAETVYKQLMLSYDDYEDFEWAAIERKFEGRAIETDQLAGWGMFELDKIDPRKGGAPRAHVDALRLVAVFLAHWDNKPDNQRLVCLSQADWGKGERCERPFALLQDLGSTFGPAKVDLDAWKEAPVWQDRAKCLTSMRELPFEGATFGEAHISEEGRQFLARMLSKLTDRQLTDLFTWSRFDDELGLMRRSSTVSDWVRVFKARVRQIAEGPPCPSMT